MTTTRAPATPARACSGPAGAGTLGPRVDPARAGRRDRLAGPRDGWFRHRVSTAVAAARDLADPEGPEALLERAASATPAQRRQIVDRVVVDHLPVARALAARFRDRGEPLDDLVQVASLALVKAAHHYEPGRGRGFLPYAVPTITGELRRHFRDRSWGVRPPRRLQELRTAVGATAAELTQARGRPPTTEELAGALGVAPAEVREVLLASRDLSLTSLDAALEHDGDEGRTAGLGDVLGVEDDGYDTVVDLLSARATLCALSERDRRVLVLRYHHGWTQARIAAEVGVTQVQVSRVLARMLSGVREALRAEAA